MKGERRTSRRLAGLFWQFAQRFQSVGIEFSKPWLSLISSPTLSSYVTWSHLTSSSSRQPSSLPGNYPANNAGKRTDRRWLHYLLLNIYVYMSILTFILTFFSRWELSDSVLIIDNGCLDISQKNTDETSDLRRNTLGMETSQAFLSLTFQY